VIDRSNSQNAAVQRLANRELIGPGAQPLESGLRDAWTEIQEEFLLLSSTIAAEQHLPDV